MRLVDPSGRFLTPDATVPAPPSSAEDIIVLPNGDLAWAYVEEDSRNYAAPLSAPDVPAKRTLSIARLRYCE
jgi:hypothetical protein